MINSGVIDRLLDLSRITDDFHKRAFEILACLSTANEFRWDLLTPKVIFESILTLASADVEQKSFAYKILHNVSSSCQEQMILQNSFLAYPTEEALPVNATIIFVHGLMGKAHRKSFNRKRKNLQTTFFIKLVKEHGVVTIKRSMIPRTRTAGPSNGFLKHSLVVKSFQRLYSCLILPH